jgi:nucleoside-diphosphate-sugar epimerase
MRVLVTGHLGFIGTVLVPILEEAGHDVVGLDTDLYAACTFGDPRAIRSVQTIDRDVRDVTARDLDGIDAVVHLAALSNDPLSDLDEELTYDINHRASIRLARAAREARVGRFIFSSSCSNYGAAGGALLDESSPLRPVTAYGRSKVLVERDLTELRDDDFTVVSLRNATAYGVSPRLRCDVVLNNLVAWGLTTGRVRLKSDGTPWRPLVHIRDISAAVVLALDAPADVIGAQAYNVGSTRANHQMRDLARIAASVIPGCEVEIASDASPDTRDYQVDCDAFAAATGFTPAWDVERGAVELYDAFVENGLTIEDVEGPRFQRIAQIRRLLEDGRLSPELRFEHARL